MLDIDQRIANRLRCRDWLTARNDEMSDRTQCVILHLRAHREGAIVAATVRRMYEDTAAANLTMGRGAVY